MKTYKANLFKLATLAGLVGAISCGPAQADEIVNQFNNATGVAEVAQWRFDFGSVTHATSFSADDATGNPSSGSMKVVSRRSVTKGIPARRTM